MTETQAYTVDVLNLLPDNSVCYIQAPSLDNPQILKILEPSPYPYYKKIILTSLNKKKLIDIIKKDEVEGFFQSVEVRDGSELLFAGYDGMEYGTISKNLKLTKEFIDSYIHSEMCSVSIDW